MSVHVQGFHHATSGTWSYLVSDRATRQAAIIDPVLDYDATTGDCDAAPAERLLDAAIEDSLDIRWLLETHAHADHVSAARWLKTQRPQARLAIGRGIRSVQKTLADTLDMPALPCDGSQFDHLFDDGDEFAVGNARARVIAVPGHTRDSLAYLIDDALFTGDSLFMPDAGTARCDFPGGDAGLLYRSIRRLYSLPPQTRVFVGHDYAPGGREPGGQTTLALQRAHNVHLSDATDEAAFVAMRQARDATLAPPALMRPALRANLEGGALPTPRRAAARVPDEFDPWDV